MAISSFLAFSLCAVLGVVMATSSENPFEGHKFYVHPRSAKRFGSVSNVSHKTKANLEKMQKVAIANWIDKKSRIRGNEDDSLEGILKDASSKSPPELVLLMWYNLPNRDCAAKASDGEICCVKTKHGKCNYYRQKGDCEDGLKEYKSEFVDPFIALLEKYEKKLPIVVVLEPDSMANIATNTENKHCGKTTQAAYRNGIKYAVKQLTTKVPSVAIYLDAANGGWMGWTSNLDQFMGALKKLDLPWKKIRGFTTNVANYQPLGIQCPWCPDEGYRNGYCLGGHHKSDPCCDDPMKLNSQYNFANNELNYAAGLVAAAEKHLGMEAHVVIDTGRNGVVRSRDSYRNWCNPRKAGAGIPSTAKTANASLTDAYFWIKTPGESDGCTKKLPGGKKCPRFDGMCESEDSIGFEDDEPRAPEAGGWFEHQAKLLAAHARFDPPKAPKHKATCFTAPKNEAYDKTSIKGEKGCADAWTQCGGGSGPWSGPTCCAAGCTCEPNGMYDDQCKPSKGEYKCVVTAKSLKAAKKKKSKKRSVDKDEDDEDESEDKAEDDKDESEDKDEDDKDESKDKDEDDKDESKDEDEDDKDESKDKDEDDEGSDADSEKNAKFDDIKKDGRIGIVVKYLQNAAFSQNYASRSLSLPVAILAAITLSMFIAQGIHRARTQARPMVGGSQAREFYNHLDPQTQEDNGSTAA